MAANERDVFEEARAIFTSLRNEISQIADESAPEKYVDEYHAALDQLEALGHDAAESRIPASLVDHKITSSWVTFEGDWIYTYSEDKYVGKAHILARLDAVLGYLAAIIPDKPGKLAK